MSVYLPQTCIIKKAYMMTDKDKFFEFVFEDGRELGHEPGQFAEVSIPGYGEAPISISSSPTKKGSFEMVIRNVGSVTNAVHQLNEGDKLNIRGPFGTTFPMDECKGKDILFVAGGIGLVPMRSAIHYVLDNRKDYGKVTIFFGARDMTQRLFTDELKEWSQRSDIDFHETLDVGCAEWKGNVGLITSCFNYCTEEEETDKKTVCFIVGPPVMYKYCIMSAHGKKIPSSNIYVSLERRMKCGIGKCGHCQIGGKFACKEGPVFKLSDIENIKGAI